jgi:hypothetical protein
MVCLAGGFGMTGQWIATALVLAPGFAWLYSQKFPFTWPAPACLIGFVFLAAFGLFEKSPAFLMVLGATAASASWDLQNLDRSMAGSSPTETARQFEKNHIQSLAIALGLGLLVAGTGLLFALQVPFVLLILLVILDLFSLDRVYRYLRNRKARAS